MTYSCGELTDGSLFANRYLVLEELGRGGMGCVYRVLDTKVDEEVALKFINPEIASDAKIIERFRTELKVTRRITHRHVCRMYDLGTDGKSLFITMEYIPGEDLEAMVRRLGKLPLDKAFVIAQQIAEGLAEVHRLGVIHRDLKPKNIMIDRDGEAKIMDFGLARTPHGVKLTEVGHVVGTPSFMSPEQINGETVDQRSDVFALGVIMFYMLTGKLPFEAETTLTLALQQKTHRPPNPHALNPHVPDNLGRIVLQCLEIDPEKRYPSAQSLLTDLDKTAVGFDTYEVHVPGRSGNKALIGATIVLALALSGLALKSLLDKPRAAETPKPGVPIPAPVRPEVKAEARPVTETDPVIKAIAVTFVTKPSRATVFVDEIEMGITDDTFLLSPGRHAVRISKPGYQDMIATLVAEAGNPGRLSQEYRLVPQSPTLGTLNVTSEPSGADVFLDGSPKPAGRTPFILGLTPGTVRVKVGLAGHLEQIETVTVRAGERSALFCSLSPQDGTVEISSDPEGAEVWSGTELLGTTPLKRQLKPAVYRLRITMKGLGDAQDIISVHPGEALQPLRYTLEKPRTALAERYFLKVTSEPPGASVTINGVLREETTPFVWELDTAEVRIKVEKGDLKIPEEVIVLRPAPARNERSYELK
jgi:tRNA A-37 threonylcarbamoyl transferase component Bud32